jgi:hypothetical protein
LKMLIFRGQSSASDWTSLLFESVWADKRSKATVDVTDELE